MEPQVTAQAAPAPSSVPDAVVLPTDLAFQPFNIPGFHGPMEAAFANVDTSKAPHIALLKMNPGAFIQKHYHPIATEAVYIIDGEMINDGQRLPKGTFLVHGPGVIHGPHATESGCTVMFIQSPGVTIEDSIIIE